MLTMTVEDSENAFFAGLFMKIGSINYRAILRVSTVDGSYIWGFREAIGLISFHEIKYYKQGT